MILPELAEMFRFPDFLIAGIIAMRIDPPLIGRGDEFVGLTLA
jgi:hypothetical protein